MRTGTGVSALTGEQGRVTGVVLGTGEEVPADLVLFGIGRDAERRARRRPPGSPSTTASSTDAALRTSADDVFAAGDVANAFNPRLGRWLRIEHWANALNGGARRGVARCAGEAVSYDDIPYFYTDQYDLGMEYSGYGALAAGAELVVRGDLDAREFIAFWLADGRVVAGMNVNVWDVNETVQRLIRSERVVDRARSSPTRACRSTRSPGMPRDAARGRRACAASARASSTSRDRSP